MTTLLIGLAIFLGVHSLRIFADDWRRAQRARLGEGPWYGLVSVVSLVGFALIVWGYGIARSAPMELWSPPAWTRHVTMPLTLVSFVLLAAALVPGNRIKAAVHHPTVLGVKVWAFAHLLSNGRLSDVLLFGAFLAWAVALFAVSRRRDRATGLRHPAGHASRDAVTVGLGVVGWFVFARWLHAWLIGVRPFG